MATAIAMKPRVGKATSKADAAERKRAVTAATTVFSLLSDATRLQVILILDGGERNVGDLCGELGLSQPALSHHLALCRHSGVIEPRREGKHNFYSLTDRGREAVKAARALVA